MSMNCSNTDTTSSRQRDRHLLIVLALYVLAIHAALLSYDCAKDFAPFFHVDRSADRVEAMQHVLEARNWSGLGHAIATNQIVVGEYHCKI